MGLLDYLGFGGAGKPFNMGSKTLKIDRHDLHAKLRDRAVTALCAKLSKKERGVILLEGGKPFHVYSTDMEAVFRQESYFHYLFGVTEDSYYGAIDVSTGDAFLFMPRLPESFSVWFGELPTPASVRSKYGVQYVHYVDEMPAVLADLGNRLHLLAGTNTDSGRPTKEASFEGIADFELERESLFDVLTECRVIKLPEEVAIQQYCNDIGSAAHVELMRYAKAGVMEYQLESIFLHYCYFKGGCRHAPYTPICGSGPKSAILHYGTADAPNDREVQEGELVLLDMGCEYYRYGSDITCTIPASGKFSERQKGVYQVVLASMRAVEAAMKPGVPWPDMHRLADRKHLEGLKALGLLTGNVDEMVEANLGALFMPHGLGHLLGIDTHDVGGYGKDFPLRSERPGLKSLRLGRPLLENMVLTVEPGIYFNPALLKPALKTNHSRFLVKKVVESYFDFGGIRLEDNVLVTATGMKTLTNVPREVEDVERVLAGGEWPVVASTPSPAQK